MRVLLVEDDRILGDGIASGLRQEGYAVDWITNGKDVVPSISSGHFDIMILDLGLPGMDGTEVLKDIRRKQYNLPVLILTARGTLQDKIMGLDTGADDYMVKPVDLEELSARIRALTRRPQGQAAPILTYRDITLDPAAHTVTKNNECIDLSPKEFSILHALMRQPGKIIPRNRLEETLYGWDESIGSNAVEVHIHHIRKKIGTDYIETVRGVGYVIGRNT